MVKQLEIFTYFLSLSSAEELPYISSKLNNLVLNDKELKKSCYQERCNLLNISRELVARHFQHKVEVFVKEMILDSPLGFTKYYAIRIEFQERGNHVGSPHVFLSIRAFNAPNGAF